MVSSAPWGASGCISGCYLGASAPQGGGPGQHELSHRLRLVHALSSRASPEQCWGSSHPGPEQNKLPHHTEPERPVWRLSDRVAKPVMLLLTGFIQLNYHILEALYLCNHEALELQRAAESCWGEETPLPRRALTHPLPGSTWRNRTSVTPRHAGSGSQTRWAPRALPPPLRAQPWGSLRPCCSVLPGSPPALGSTARAPRKLLPPAGAFSSRTTARQPVGRQKRQDLGTEDQTPWRCHHEELLPMPQAGTGGGEPVPQTGGAQG